MKNNNYFGNSSINFSNYDFDKIGYTKIPEPKVNGGLYTGELFKPNAPYANIPAVPDSGYLINQSLRTADPPKQALTQYPNIRPGNNMLGTPGITDFANNKLTCKSIKE